MNCSRAPHPFLMAALLATAGCGKPSTTETGDGPGQPDATPAGRARIDESRAVRGQRVGRDGDPIAQAATRQSAAVAATPQLPTRFHGLWAADPDACAGPGDPSRLHVTASELRFHESAGAVTAVRIEGDTVQMALRLTGEGETRDTTYVFRLSDGDRVLTDTAGGFQRQRCR